MLQDRVCLYQCENSWETSLKWSQEVQQAELSHPITLVNCIPNRKRQTLQVDATLLSAEGRKPYLISLSPNSPASENLLYFQLPAYSNGFSVYNCLSNLAPPFSIKEPTTSLFSELAYGFTILFIPE